MAPLLITTPPPGSVIRDEILKVRLVVRCDAAPEINSKEPCTPEVGNGKLIFGGPGGARCSTARSNPMTVSGDDKLIAPPGKVTAKDP